MGNIVLELQHELLEKDCDILNVLRKAHVISSKLNLTEFDKWIMNELNGYDTQENNIPEYRQMNGVLKAKNPYRGWIPAVITDKNNKSLFNSVPIYESVSALIDIEKKSNDGYFYYSYPPEVSMKICSQANTPTYMEIALFISTIHIIELIDKIRNYLLEWTLELERKGILGENMTFSEKESKLAKEIPQSVNNYYGTVVVGEVNSSQILSGDNNTNVFNFESMLEAIQEIRDSINSENIAQKDKDEALEILEDISMSIKNNKKPGIIKSALMGLKDFIIAVGAEVSAALILTKIQGM